MKTLLLLLQVGRVGLAWTAISNIWLMVFLSRAIQGASAHALPLGQHLLWTALTATGLYVFGMTLNDLMDKRHDRHFAPNRPLPSGRLSMTAAGWQAALALLTALGSSCMLGATHAALCLACATLIVFYDTLAKHIPGAGLLILGLIRGLNMFIAAPDFWFIWPVWVTFSHVIGISAAAYRLEAKRPVLAGFHLWLLTGGWAFFTVFTIAWENQQSAGTRALVESWLWVGPILASAVFVTLAVRQTQKATSERAAGGKLIKLGLLWVIVLDSSWLLSAGLWLEAACIGALLPIALGSMSLLRWLNQLCQGEPAFLKETPSPDRFQPPPSA